LLLSEGNQRQFAVEVENKRDFSDSVPQRGETPGYAVIVPGHLTRNDAGENHLSRI